MSTPGVSVGHEDHRAALVGVDVGVGDAHDDQEVGHRAVGREPLVAVDHALVAVAHGAGLDEGGVGAGPGLGHGEGAAQRPVEQRLRATARADPRGPVSSIPMASSSALPESGALLPKTTGPRRDWPEDLVHQPEPHLAEAHPAELGRKVGGPETLRLHLVLERPDAPRAGWPCSRSRVSSGRISSSTKPAPTPAWPRTPARSRSPMPMALRPPSTPTPATVSPMPGDARLTPTRSTVSLRAPDRGLPRRPARRRPSGRRALGACIAAAGRRCSTSTARSSADELGAWPSCPTSRQLWPPWPTRSGWPGAGPRWRSRGSSRPRPAAAPRTATSAPSRRASRRP